jgi:exonuclease III
MNTVPKSHLYRYKRSTTENPSELSDTIDLANLRDFNRIWHPTTRKYTFFSAVHRTFSKIDHISGSKAGFNKYKKFEITRN